MQDVLTQHNDNFRTGATLDETLLTTATLNDAHFGKLYTRAVDGDIYAQPLYVSNLDLGERGQRNVVYVATMKNNVYAFDADNYDPNPFSGLLWGPVNLGTPEQGREDINGNHPPYPSCSSAAYYGITSTPVIDRVNNWMYLVAKTVDDHQQFHQYLHRLDIRTGRGANPNASNTPLEIVAQLSNSQGAVVTFDPSQLNRASLLLANRMVYIAFASHCDFGTYHGWIMAYDATTLHQVAIFNTTPDDAGGGVWQSGNGLAADRSGNIYFQVGNRTTPEPGHASDVSESIVQLSANLSNPLVFKAPNFQHLNAEDLDIGSSGPLLMPESQNNELIGGGKSGRLYVLDCAIMHLKQTFKATVNVSNPELAPEDCTYGPDHYGTDPANTGQTLCPHIHSGLVYWHGPEAAFARVYVWGERDCLRAYHYDVHQGVIVDNGGVAFPVDDTNTVSTAPNKAQKGNVFNPLHDPDDLSRVMPGPTLSLSANQTQAGTGILWATQTVRDNAEYRNVYGILRAFDAVTLQELWNSRTDQFDPNFLGRYAKYAAPTIANGNVFVPTFSNQLVVYGPRSRALQAAARWQQWSMTVEPWPSQPPLPRLPMHTRVTPIARNPTIVDLYAVKSDGAVWNVGWWAQGDQWHAGYPVSAAGFASPGAPLAVVSRNPNIVDVYVVRPDGSVWNAGWWAADVNQGRWNAGYQVSPPGFAPSGAPLAVVSRNPNIVDLFVVRADGSVWNAGWWAADVNQGHWNAGYPISIQNTVLNPQAIVTGFSRNAGHTDLFMVGRNGQVFTAWWDVQVLR